MKQPVTLVASTGLANEIGRDGDLCWHIREDLKHFKQLTMGGAVIMGRLTWNSLPKRPLPGRLNIVVTRSEDFSDEGALRAGSLEEALEMAGDREAFIIGGESIYRQAMPLATKLELTVIEANDRQADKFFPEIDPRQWEVATESELMHSADDIPFRFVTYSRT